MTKHDNVVSLFVSEADLEASYRRYDTAMMHLAALHRDEESTYESRWHAALAALEAEKEFRQTFARHAPVRTAGA